MSMLFSSENMSFPVQLLFSNHPAIEQFMFLPSLSLVDKATTSNITESLGSPNDIWHTLVALVLQKRNQGVQ